MRIVFAPAPTGSGHNMRSLALARELRRQSPDAEVTVLLGSLQPTFGPLFDAAGVKVIDIAGDHVDHATRSNLTRELGWQTYIKDYAAPAFVNGERVLGYLSHYQDLAPDLVVSDYNISASMAAAIAGVPHALVTERYDFTLLQIDDSTLEAGGFKVDREDLRRGRNSLHAVFDWIVSTAEIVLTDKPYVPELDAGTSVAAALDAGRAVFTGPMIREIPERGDGEDVRASLGLGPGPVMVGSVGGTSMFWENKQRVIESYILAHRRLKHTHPDLQLVLLGREWVEAPDDVVVLTYLPDWMPLLQEADVLLSAPGWITVTEVAALRVPTVFVLSSLAEYHEVEASDRLGRLGFPSLIAPAVDQLADAVRPFIGARGAGPSPAHLAIAPEGSGTARAAGLLAEAARGARGDRASRGAGARGAAASRVEGATQIEEVPHAEPLGVDGVPPAGRPPQTTPLRVEEPVR
ncbi:hypothetical protein [Streptomyces sp. NPDC051576]|uniref:hypothetical protein n=1 Tax=Streptomyces sp. NPDC051576 TaxID=3155803 RepID=UPI00342762EC